MSAAATEQSRRAIEGGTDMATTSSTLVAGKVASQGGNGNNGGYGLKAKVTASVAILGCAAALAFGGLRGSEGAQAPAVAPAVAVSAVSMRERQYFLEQNLNLPEGGATPPITREQQRFLEQNTQLPTGGMPAPLS